MKKPSLRYLLAIAAVASLLVALPACGGDDDDDGGNGNGATATTPANNGNGDNGDNGDVEEVSIAAKDNFFEPKEITIPAGKTVTITLKNEGTAIHNMVVKDTEFKSDMVVNAGKESSFEVKFDEPGTYDFQCDYHVPDMVGTITVQ